MGGTRNALVPHLASGGEPLVFDVPPAHAHVFGSPNKRMHGFGG